MNDRQTQTVHSRLFCFLACLAVPALAAAQEEFYQCRDRLASLAIERGISESVATEVLADVEPLERVIQADRNQPEFIQSFDRYIGLRVTPDRVATGRALYAEHRTLLDQLAARHGVPGQYLVAFWGLESDFGRVLGNIPVFDSLTTLACDERRSRMFTDELINAMTIVERGDAEPAQMTGSWAGAMGQTQFMPSVYLQHATDGDGDGRADLWQSPADALSSAARFVASMGWVPGFRWGREVLLPDGFDYSLAGSDQPRSLSAWRQLGLTSVAGDPIPVADIDAALIVPAGSDGPAFLVYRNFDVIMRWNRSEFFALSIGHLADRIAGAGGLSRPPAGGDRLTRDQMRAIQAALTDVGFDPGPADGVPGPATRAAIRAFQASLDLVADGFADMELLARLGID
ncbi:MAG: lytic murein transglycosylase [Gammaproteobacteria bacterium]|jgi:membrane-bound lytic murein transglycosylase B